MKRFGWRAILVGAALAVLVDFAAGLLLRASGLGATGFIAVASVIVTFLAYGLGGIVAGKISGGWGGLNGLMVAVVGFILEVVLGFLVALVSLATGASAGQQDLPANPEGAVMAALVVGVVSFLLTFVGGYLGGKLGERSSRRGAG